MKKTNLNPLPDQAGDDESQESRELWKKAAKRSGGKAFVYNLALYRLLNSPEFKKELDAVSQEVFNNFGPSPRYGEWKDLRQEILLNFVPWFKNYEETGTLKPILNRIATNLCIDEARRQQTMARAHVEKSLGEVGPEGPRGPDARDTDARVFFEECRSRLSGKKLVVFDEYFTEGRSLMEIAKRHGFSAQTAVNIFTRILTEIRGLVSGHGEFGGGAISNASGTHTKAEQRQRHNVANRMPATAAKTAEGKLEQVLLEAGLLSEVPPRITDFRPYQKRKPVRVKGKPVSETIVEERR